MLGWDPYRFYEKRTGMHFAELVFLHPVRFAGHIVLSGVLGT
jgi:hypothetical protein